MTTEINSVTDDYVHLVGNFEIWDRGDGIAEVADKSLYPPLIFMWIHRDGSTCDVEDTMVSAFSGVVKVYRKGTEYNLLDGLKVQSISELKSLLIGIERGKSSNGAYGTSSH